MANLYFLADLHISHTNCIKFCNRPFTTIEEMDKTIISNINNKVQENDTLVIVGDFCFGTAKQVREVRNLIKCKNVILCTGNHDKSFSKQTFTLVVDKLEMNICGQRVIISHYPFRLPWWKLIFAPKHCWKFLTKRIKDDGKTFLIYGHTHSKNKGLGREIHVGVDGNKFQPVSLQEIEARIQRYLTSKKK